MINLLFPKYTKYKSNHMYKLDNTKKPYKLNYGDWGIAAYKNGVITPNQIEASRCCLSRNMKDYGKIWIKVFPNHMVSKRPKDSRMGAGKGKIFKWLFIVSPGDIIFEASKAPIHILIKIFKLVEKKLPIKIKLIINKKNVI